MGDHGRGVARTAKIGVERLAGTTAIGVVSKNRVPRLRWFEFDTEDSATPLDWRCGALTTATLFLNLFFWYAEGLDFRMSSRLPIYAVWLAAAALLIAALFFIGPALATHRAKKPLFGVLAESFGSWPALALRVCCLAFLVIWTGNLLALPGFWWLRQHLSSIDAELSAGVILLFLFLTGLQSPRTSASLAVFTNKLGIAILFAALLRVHQGWPMAWNGRPTLGQGLSTLDLLHGLSLLTYDVAPLSLLAASLCCRISERKRVITTALAGIVLPLFVTLLLVGLIDVATISSRYYQPSLNPNVGMALWSRAASSAIPGRIMVAAITTFGAARFGARSLAEAVAFRRFERRILWAALACLGALMVWCSQRVYDSTLSATFESAALVLTVAGAVLTADLVTGRTKMAQAQKIDWIGVSAVLAGVLTPAYGPFLVVIANPYWHPWLLPSFGIGFLVAFISGTVQKMRRAPRIGTLPDA